MTKETKYLSGIILKDHSIVTKTGTREEIEQFIFENIDNLHKCKTKNLDTNRIDEELTMVL